MVFQPLVGPSFVGVSSDVQEAVNGLAQITDFLLGVREGALGGLAARAFRQQFGPGVDQLVGEAGNVGVEPQVQLVEDVGLAETNGYERGNRDAPWGSVGRSVLEGTFQDVSVKAPAEWCRR